MKFMQMIYFREVCRTNNISKASKELFVSQPAISSSIKALEQEFGLQLFHRNNNKLFLTPEGEFFNLQIQEILDGIEKLELKMKDLGKNHNRIKIGVPPMIGIFLFPKIFNEFKAHYPKTEIEIRESGSLEIRRYVSDDVVDVAIGILDKDMSSQFNLLPLYETELVFAVNKGHPLAQKKTISFPMLTNEKIILMKADSFQNPKIRERFASLGIEPNVFLYSSQLYTIKKFISYGNCGAFVFREIAEMDDDMVPIAFEDPIKISIGLIWKQHTMLYRETENFIDFIRKSFPDHK
jgi:DNA-binding transcriptional LysR family regulator